MVEEKIQEIILHFQSNINYKVYAYSTCKSVSKQRNKKETALVFYRVSRKKVEIGSDLKKEFSTK